MTNMRKNDDRIIARAQRALERLVLQEAQPIYSAQDVAPFLQMKLAPMDREVFGVLFLDTMRRPLAFEVLFLGTVNKVRDIHPREIARGALRHNAVAVILCHNHPSGNHNPSMADRALTDNLRGILSVLDIEVLDHIVVSAMGWTSMTEFSERPKRRKSMARSKRH